MADFEKASQKAREFRQREEDILTTAMSLFTAHGEEKVTVEMIADHVGIGKGTIYKHFETKNEIIMRLMIRYEEELAQLFQTMSPEDDKEKLAREYFQFRMKDPEKYILFDQMERKLRAENKENELFNELHKVRMSNFGKLSDIVTARVREGSLEDVPPQFHVMAAWALVHGAVGLYQSDFYRELIDDQQEFFSFLMDIGVRMGNKGKRGR